MKIKKISLLIKFFLEIFFFIFNKNVNKLKVNKEKTKIKLLNLKKENNSSVKKIIKILIEYFSIKEKFFISKYFSEILSIN
tara:strand:- start:349 stop:591 length:243 start_codon:yes stop_codon:yes gene_type:complete